MVQILFATQSDQSRSLPLSAQLLVNLFTEKQSPGAKSQAPLFGVPGMTAFAACGTSGPVRGFWLLNDILYAVSADSLYSVALSGATVLVGSHISGSQVVSMSDNGTQLCIVNGAAGWIYTIAGGLVPITSPAFYPANTVTFFDGYFVFDRAGTNEFFISALYDGLSYNGLDFATAEAQPDFVVATTQNLQLLFIFCQTHIEMWYDAGTADFPFQRYAGGVINYGCVSPYTILKQDGAIFFLGADKVFYRLQANIPIRISTHAIEHIIAQDFDITAALCFTYTLEGHKFINLVLPYSMVSLVYDISTGLWHNRESWDQNSVSLGRWRANCAINAYGKNYVGDAFNGNVSLVDWTVYTEQGNTIRGRAVSATLHQDRKRLFMSRFELDVQAGVGLASGQGSDPQIMMQVSVDGGQTFRTLQPWRSMGMIGQYLKRLRWLRQGQGRQLTIAVEITDPVPRVLIAAHADISIGM